MSSLDERAFERLQNSKNQSQSLLDEMISKFEVTAEDVAHIADQRFIYRDVFIDGQLTVVVGRAGAGKTTIMYFVCAAIKLHHPEKEVIYVNADINAEQMKRDYERASKAGFRLLCPDAKAGGSMRAVVEYLEGLASSEGDLSHIVIVLDTLKKCVSVINKTPLAEFMKLVRRLVNRGATVFMLGHCNKFKDHEGWPIYEGCGDVRNDVDALAFLIHAPADFGKLQTSLYWNDEDGPPEAKRRGANKPITWEIDTENGMTVTEVGEWIDTKALAEEKRELLQTQDVVLTIATALQKNSSGLNQGELVERCPGFGQKKVVEILNRYAGEFWDVQSGGEKNRKIYTIRKDANLPKPRMKKW